MDRKELVLRDVKIRENVLLRNAYLWMFLGLIVTALTAFFVVNSRAAIRLVYNPAATIIIFIAEIALVMVLSGRIERLSTGKAIGIFIAYSALTGLTLSSIFFAYRIGTIAYAFLSASAVFAGGALYGTLTKKDVSGWGRYLTMGLFGLIGATLINMLFRSSSLDLMISLIGVVIFTGLAVWDSKRISDINNSYGSLMTSEELTKVGILGALSLYLDFLNIFLYLLRIFARSDRR